MMPWTTLLSIFQNEGDLDGMLQEHGIEECKEELVRIGVKSPKDFAEVEEAWISTMNVPTITKKKIYKIMVEAKTQRAVNAGEPLPHFSSSFVERSPQNVAPSGFIPELQPSKEEPPFMGNLFGTHTPRPGKPVGIFFPDDLNEINDEDTLAPMQIQFEHAPTAPDFPATLDTFRTTEDANRSVEGEDNSAEAMDRDLNAEVSGPGEDGECPLAEPAKKGDKSELEVGST